MTREWKLPIERGAILAFARSIGDPNPIYFDEEYAAKELGHVIAPPTFVVASAHFDEDYPFRPPVAGSGRSPTVVGAVAFCGEDSERLHAEQHFEYHRAVVPGETLTVCVSEGESWERAGREGRRLRFSASISRYYSADGELVVTSRCVVVSPLRPSERG